MLATLHPRSPVIRLLARLLLVMAVLALVVPAAASPSAAWTVNSAADGAAEVDANPGDGLCQTAGGDCTLRAAVMEANASAGPDTIDFASPMVITLSGTAGPLPALTGATTIDAGAVWNDGDGLPGVTIRTLAAMSTGLQLSANTSRVSGLHLTGFADYALLVEASHITIGGTAYKGNVLSGSGAGLALIGEAASDITVQGNIIGLLPGGSGDPNGDGIYIEDGANDILIGGGPSDHGNLIFGNDTGLNKRPSAGGNVRLGGNLIGHPSSPALGNTGYGLFLASARTQAGGPGLAPNTIANNGSSGILLTDAYQTQIISNTITSNGYNGIDVLNTPDVDIFANTIAANGRNGVLVQGGNSTRVEIFANSIYTNTLMGIDLIGGANQSLSAPVINSAAPDGASGTACTGCRVLLYSDQEDEGQIYEGFVLAVDGTWAYTQTLTGPNITALAINSLGSTSEFSAPFPFNRPPYTPAAPLPPDGAEGVGLEPTLSWSGGDPDGDPVTYTVSGGLASAGSLDQWCETTAKSCQPPAALQVGEAYSWQVTAEDGNFAPVAGPTWTFTTTTDLENLPPYTPSDPKPADHAVDTSTTPTLSWTGGDPEGDVVTYTVTGGLSSAIDMQIWCETTLETCQPPAALQLGEEYSWYVAASDGANAPVYGPYWHFTTQPLAPPLENPGLYLPIIAK